MRKEKQRKRTMRFFIDAASQLISDHSIDEVTIRKVADIAGYNSATLYNYFENLNHLKSLAALTFTFDYISDLGTLSDNYDDSWLLNEAIWESFYRHSYYQPHIFYSIFGELHPQDFDGHFKQFFDLYPERIENLHENIQQMLIGENIYDRTLFLLKRIVADGLIDPRDIDDLNELLYFTYKGMMTKLLSDDSYTKEEFVTKGMAYTRRILNCYKKHS